MSDGAITRSPLWAGEWREPSWPGLQVWCDRLRPPWKGDAYGWLGEALLSVSAARVPVGVPLRIWRRDAPRFRRALSRAPRRRPHLVLVGDISGLNHHGSS